MMLTLILLHGLGCYVLGLLTGAWIVWDINRNKAKEQ